MHHYVVTAQSSTSVSNCLKGNFVSQRQISLVACKGTLLEIYNVEEEKLKLLANIPFSGKILTMHLVKKIDSLDAILVTTDRWTYHLLKWNQQKSTLVSEGSGDCSDKAGMLTEVGQMASVDLEGRLAVVHVYQGQIRVIPFYTEKYAKWFQKTSSDSDLRGKGPVKPSFKPGDLGASFAVRIAELNIIHLTLIPGLDVPTLAILYRDRRTREAHVKFYTVLPSKDKELTNSFIPSVRVEGNARMLIPLTVAQGGGLLVCGEQSLTHIDLQGKTNSIPMNVTIMKCFDSVDDARLLLGDHYGNLYVLLLKTDKGLHLEKLGTISSPTSVAHIRDNIAFVGSHFGDSQLIRILNEPNEQNSLLEVMDTLVNIAPISDFVVADVEKQGQSQVVTCSGAFKDGSLRVIRNGIGIQEIASMEMEGLKSVYSLKPCMNSREDTMLVLSFVNDTRILCITDEGELAEENIPGFDGDSATLACRNVVGDYIVQVTSQKVLLLELKAQDALSTWKPDSRILSASISPSQIVVALTDGELVYLEVKSSSIQESARCKMQHDIACVDISTNDESSSWCAVGLWTDNSVRLLSVPSLKQVAKESLGGEIIPRSVLLTTFNDTNYLFVGMGDGHVFSFVRDEGHLKDKKRTSLGTQPITLTQFKDSNGRQHVFSSSDRPTVVTVSGSGQKLEYSTVTLNDAQSMCSFQAASFPNALAFATENQLVIGTLDEIQKLDIRTIRLGETPRRIVHQPSSRSFGVLSIRISVEQGTGNEAEEGLFRIFDHASFDVLDTIHMEPDEHTQSIISTHLKGDSTDYYVVGTAFVDPEQDEPTKGRILVYRVTENRQLELISQTETRGAVYTLAALSDGSLIAGIGSKVYLFDWMDDENGFGLVKKAMHHGNVLIISMTIRDDFILVGDLMKSVSVLVYNKSTGSFSEVCRDYDTNWVTAVEMFDKDNYISCDTSGNLLSLRRMDETASEDLRRRLEHSGEYHLSHVVNRFRHGSLAMNMEESEPIVSSSLLYATTLGSLGVVAILQTKTFNTLKTLEHNLELYSGSLGVPHSIHRALITERRQGTGSPNYVDGDLIETFLDLTPQAKEDVVKGTFTGATDLNKDVVQVTRLVEELSRIH